MRLNLGCVTDRGNYRDKNQDRIMCDRKMTEGHVLAIACVCDGIGSFAESEIASQMMTGGIRSWFEGIVPYFQKAMEKAEIIDDLEFTIRELNELVYEYGIAHKTSIGCTMSLMLIIDWEYWVFHVGDSRIYCLRDTLQKITQDEVVLRQINGRDKTFLVNYIGKGSMLALNKQKGHAEDGDVFILGTDGLYKKLIYMDVKDKFHYLDQDKQIEAFCGQLVEQVLARGERDNISCAVLKLTGKEQS